MKTYNDSELRQYEAPISDTEDQKCQRAINMVRDALKELGWRAGDAIRLGEAETSNWMLSMDQLQQDGTQRKITIFVQGSYANRTNIPSESDVDVAVILEDALNHFWINQNTTTYTDIKRDCLVLMRFKNEVLDALKKKFSYGVERGNKSIKVKGNTYRVDADVVPCGRAYGFFNNGGIWKPVIGIRIQADDGATILNFPEQHIRNGVKKNSATNTRFKKSVRILKSIRCDMEQSRIESAKQISSFLIESLLWNVPHMYYITATSIGTRMTRVIYWLFSHRESLSEFMEINGIKKLGDDDSSRLIYCNNFISDIMRYCRFEA